MTLVGIARAEDAGLNAVEGKKLLKFCKSAEMKASPTLRGSIG